MILLARNALHTSAKIVTFLLVLVGSFISFAAKAQTPYTYTKESFEAAVWGSAPGTLNSIASSTGTWQVARNNIKSTAVPAQDSASTLVLATKTNALITPLLTNGASVLTYNMIRVGGSRTLIVTTSRDNITWSRAIDSVSVQTTWSMRRIVINDPAVRYIKFEVNSNGGVYLDNLLITSPGAQGITVVTATPTSVTQTSAVVGGTVTSTGTDPILSRGVAYDTQGFPDVTSPKVVAAGTTGPFTATLTNLTPGQTYYLKAYAVTAVGVSYGALVALQARPLDLPLAYFTQPFNDPTHMPSAAPTSPVSIAVPNQGTWVYLNAYKGTNRAYIKDGSVSALRMLKNGSYVITPLLGDGVTELSFFEGRGGRALTIYSSTDGGTSWTLLANLTTNKDSVMVIPVNSSAVNRLKIANESGGDADIDNLTVTVYPTGTLPTVTTLAVTTIGKNDASSGGTVTNAGTKPVEERGLVWAVNAQPFVGDNKVTAGNGIGAFTAGLTGLPAGSSIHVRAFASSRSGTAYGNEITFTTLAATIPVVTTTTATAVKGELATSGGNITDNGGAPITARGVVWSTTANPTTQNSKTTDGTGTGTFGSLVINLTPNTTYFYRAYAQNSAGTGYGAQASFTTIGVGMPAVTTAPVTASLYYKATGGGVVTSDGNAMTVRGIVWNRTGNPTLTDNKKISGSGEGPYPSLLENLVESTTYYVRAYVTNSVGTAYGNQVVFTTPASTWLTEPIGYGERTTGGGRPTAANTITVTTGPGLAAALTGPQSVILVSGTITTARIQLVANNKTIIGLPGARLKNLDNTRTGSGILYFADSSSNIIVRNLIFEGPGAKDVDGHDLLTTKGCKNMWVDHCDFQDGVDGNFDNSANSDDITVSWCKFSYLKPVSPGGNGDHRFSNLIGGSDSDAPDDGRYSITWHNNWWAQGVKARMVRARNAELHMLNNYWNSAAAEEALGFTAGTNGVVALVEGGVFELPSTARVVDINGTQIAVNFLNTIGIGSVRNTGVVPLPTYDYNPMAVNLVKAAVTSPTCGAGATLQVSSAGAITINCGTITGTTSELGLPKAKIYPTLVDDFLTIELPESIKGNTAITIYSSTGKVVFKQSKSTRAAEVLKLNLQSLTSGLYIIRVEYNETIMSQKVIKQ